MSTVITSTTFRNIAATNHEWYSCTEHHAFSRTVSKFTVFTGLRAYSDRPGVRFQPGPGSKFLAGDGVLILAGAGAGNFWSRFGAQCDLLKLLNYLNN